MTNPLPSEILSRCTADGWYQADLGSVRPAGDCHMLGETPVAILAVRMVCGPQWSPDRDDEANASRQQERLLRFATPAEMEIANFGRKALREGKPETYRDRVDAKDQRARISAES